MHPKRLPLKPHQESVWDYPRPPRVEATSARILIRLDGVTIADTSDAVRVLETSHPPVYYVARSAFADGVLASARGTSFCEFKGEAHYVDVGSAARAGWFYPKPSRGFEALVDRIAVYPGAMESCSVDGELVTAQEGDFYGGWITNAIVGPFKGAPGTLGW